MNKYIFKMLLALLAFLVLPQLTRAQNEGDRINVTDTSVKKNFMDIDAFTDSNQWDSKWIVSGWDYTGGGIYEFNKDYLNYGSFPNYKLTRLLEDKDKYFYSVKVLRKVDESADEKVILCGGYFSKCLCAVMVRKTTKNDYWEEVLFDDSAYPYISNINCIETNVPNSNDFSDYSRVFLGCTNGSIFYSDNKGLTFKKSTIYADNESIKRIQFYDANTGLALAGTNDFDNTKLYKTTDGGVNWYLLKDFTNDNIILYDLHITKINSFRSIDYITLLTGSKNNKGIIKISVDYGETFSDNEVLSNDSDSNKLPGPIVSCSVFPESLSDEENFVAMMDNGIIGYCQGNYPSPFYFPYNYKEDYPIGKMTKIIKPADAVPGPMIGIGYSGLIYQFLINWPVNVNEDIVTSDVISIYDRNSQILKFNVEKNENNDVVKISVHNLIGEKIAEKDNVTTNPIEIQLPLVSQGIYFFELRGKKFKKSGKFLIY